MSRIRASPEDFFVEEIPLFPPLGEGSHSHLWVEKRLRTTDDVARSIAEILDLPRREVGYAGRKDRVAVTRQWFSVPVTRSERLAGLAALDGAAVLRRERHPERLRVGQLQGNRFRLVVREVDEPAAERALGRLAELCRHGLPNRFGRQRFGRDGRNAERGAEILASQRVRGDRRRSWLMVSALQSAVFNRVVERRAASLAELLEGDLAIVHATGDLFPVVDPAAEAERLERFEISPTGPIFGSKMRSPRGQARRIEDEVMAELGLADFDPRRLPRGLKLYGDRRPLRVQPREAGGEWRDDALQLTFELPAGSYATVLLEELFLEGFDEGPEREGAV